MKDSSKHFWLNCLVIGAALFSMFFGAGNMIFPPFLGFEAGTSWLAAFVCYFMADIGLAMVAMFALIRKGSPEGIMQPMGNAIGTGLLCMIALCTGMFIAIPRTAATTYELSIFPLFNGISLQIFCVVFFLLVLLLCLTESAVVDIVGKILTPVLFVGLLILIAIGILNPVGPLRAALSPEAVLATGIRSGYQTMDVFGAIFLGVLLLKGASEKGYSSTTAQAKVAGAASIIASSGLLVVYLGLTYLGATASTLYSGELNHTQLLISLISILLPGNAGKVFFGIVVGMACLTTAIALTSASASFFASLAKGKISYRLMVVIICVVSAVFACVGVDQIVSFASIILSVAYPPVLVLVVLSFMDRWVKKWAFRLGAYAAAIVSLAEVLSLGDNFLSSLPLASLGFAWLLPAALGCLIGQLCSRISKRFPRKSDVEI